MCAFTSDDDIFGNRITGDAWLLHDWVSDFHVHAADTLSFSGLDLNVAFFTPGFAPGIFKNEVLSAVLILTEANSHNTVVNIVATILGVKDTRFVTKEVDVVGINPHVDWSVDKGFLDSLRFRIHQNDIRYSCFDLGFIEVASMLSI